jgi:Tol biopolymer transport system component
MLAALGCTLLVWGQAEPAKTQGGIWVGKWEKDGVVAGSIRLLSPKDGGTYLQPMMHPDGTKVVFWGRGPGEGQRETDIWVVNVDGTDCHRVTKDHARNEGASWTADGRIIWSSQRGGDPGMRIWVMDADGSNPRAVTAGPPPCHDTRACASPDGTWAVFGSNRAGGTEQKLWKAPMAGGGKVEPVATGPGSHQRPVFSHDGKRLAWFTTDSPTKAFNLVVMDWPDGKPRQPVNLGPRDNLRGPFWMRDHKRVLVHGRLKASPVVRLYLIDVDTGKWKEVDVPGSLSAGHGTLDKDEKIITFDGTRQIKE